MPTDQTTLAVAPARPAFVVLPPGCVLCPKCGEHPVSAASDRYCGKCEDAYQKERVEDAKFRLEEFRRVRARHSDDCECELCSRPLTLEAVLAGL